MGDVNLEIKLNNLDERVTEIEDSGGGGGTPITVDSELSDTSTNPVQNKVITNELSKKGTYSKPTGGIPKTDFSSEVQASLDNVDTLATEVDALSKNVEVLSVPVAITNDSLQSDYCTIQKNNTYKIGKLVVGFLMIKITQDIPVETCMIKGLPRPKSDQYVLSYDGHSVTKRIQLNATVGDTDGQFYSFLEQFTKDSYLHINFTYVCD